MQCDFRDRVSCGGGLGRQPTFLSIHLARGAAALHSMPFSLPCFLWGRKFAPLPVTVLFHVVTSPCFASASVLCWLREWRWCSGRGQKSLWWALVTWTNLGWCNNVFGHILRLNIATSTPTMSCWQLAFGVLMLRAKSFGHFPKPFQLRLHRLLPVWVE